VAGDWLPPVSVVQASATSSDASSTDATRQLVPGRAYRIIREALTNTLRHAGPTAQAAVTICYGYSGVEVEVVDDG
jgi:nitrate/nitrite-specific signal transduction histidine kinase